MVEDRHVLAGIVLRAQADFRAAWERHRREQTEETRLELEKARRELDEVQRVAVVETVPVAAKR